MRRIGLTTVLAISILLAPIAGWAQPASPPSPSEGSNIETSTVTDRRMVADARRSAEKYWNALKTSDEKLFRSVTPHDSMDVVFGWLFVRDSAIRVEAGRIAAIRDNLRSFLASAAASKRAEESSSPGDPSRMKALEEALEHSKKASEYAKKIETLYPFLGDFLQRGYWQAITPSNVADSSRCRLMGYEYVADVDYQSRAGTTLKKRVPTGHRPADSALAPRR